MTIVESVSARTAQTSLIGVPPLPQCEVSVIVPVKDEAQTLVATLTALANQTDLNGQPLNPLTYEIIVLANNCIDESAAIAWFQSRRKLRSLWQRLSPGSQLSLDEVEPLAGKLGISANWLFAELRQHHTFGRLFDRVTQRQQQSYLNHWQSLDIMTAIWELRQYLATLNQRASQDIR